MRLLPLLLLLGSWSFGQSQQADQNENGNAQSRQRRTNRSKPPLVEQSTAEKISADSQANKATKKDAEERIAIYTENLASYTDKLANYTLVLGLVTLALVLVGVFQFVALMRQANALGHHSELIAESIEEMRKAVSAYERYATTGEGAVLLASQANDQTKESIGLASKSLMLTHRPRLVVRAFDTTSLQVGSIAKGKFYIVNVGGTPAHITEIYATVIVRATLPMKMPYEGIVGRSVDRSLAPGESMYWTFSKDDGALTEEESPEIATPSRALLRPEVALRIHALGFVKYSDDQTPPTPRQTRFCRMFNPDRGRFETVEDEDYESAD